MQSGSLRISSSFQLKHASGSPSNFMCVSNTIQKWVTYSLNITIRLHHTTFTIQITWFSKRLSATSPRIQRTKTETPLFNNITKGKTHAVAHKDRLSFLMIPHLLSKYIFFTEQSGERWCVRVRKKKLKSVCNVFQLHGHQDILSGFNYTLRWHFPCSFCRVCLILALQLWAESVINVLSAVTWAKFRAFRLFLFSAGLIFEVWRW